MRQITFKIHFLVAGRVIQQKEKKHYRKDACDMWPMAMDR